MEHNVSLHPSEITARCAPDNTPIIYRDIYVAVNGDSVGMIRHYISPVADPEVTVADCNNSPAREFGSGLLNDHAWIDNSIAGLPLHVETISAMIEALVACRA